ncbi:Mediator of RNA polymerase II transcription subunit 7 [Aspergillus nanangensis]|uniref:Mediator of RNA polymerase II transcription subunit 7 n=1 Tax=Aspergillus nanangensis TaxID=2582783 RepID=A0AAD4GXR1_ASPNN|nr:Mediator of RNA polymerase II transcription subunit 7 [Aspergillus nanangensis]
MAEAEKPPPPLATAFAPPPPLWKHFTAENVKRLEKIKKEASKGQDGKPRLKKWSPEELRALNLPSELRFLVPPEIPTKDHYNVFGEVQSLSTALPALTDQGITQLYPSPPTAESDRVATSEPSKPLNHAYYLLKISKSLLLNFLEFVGVLSIAPEQFQDKVNDLRTLFINAHHLLNLYRPHQARESLITMMEEQLGRSKDEIQHMDRLKAEITDALEKLKTQGIDVDAATKSTMEDLVKATASKEQPTDDSKLLWELLDDNN